MSQSPALYWRLGETSGDIAGDLSGNGRDGTYLGTYVLGKAGPLTGDRNRAVSLAGNGMVRSSYNPFSNGSARTFGGWARLDAPRHNHAFFGGASNSNRYLRHVSSTRDIEWSGVATFVDAVPSLEEWFHWVLVIDEPNSSLSLHVNGRLVGTRTDFTQRWVEVGNLQVGGLGAVPSSAWDGLLGEIAVWERALSPTEILKQHATGSTRRFPRRDPNSSGEYCATTQSLGPSLYWRLGEGSVDESITDSSGFNNDGFYGDAAGTFAITVGQPGAVDGDPSVRFTDPTPGGPNKDTTVYGRAYDYSPFVVGGQMTITGIVKMSARTSAPFQTIFASSGPGNHNCALEVGPRNEARLVRWYSNVANGVSSLRAYDFFLDWRLGVWTHYVFTWNDETQDAQLWIDGKRLTRALPSVFHKAPRAFQGNEGTFQIANRGDYSYEIWDGWVDEVAAFERILSPLEIAELSSAAAAGIRSI